MNVNLIGILSWTYGPDIAEKELEALLTPLRYSSNMALASINPDTDDQGISGIDLHYELGFAAPQAGLTMEQIQLAQLNGLETSFLSAGGKGKSQNGPIILDCFSRYLEWTIQS